jgi:hypothetical protein
MASPSNEAPEPIGTPYDPKSGIDVSQHTTGREFGIIAECVKTLADQEFLGNILHAKDRVRELVNGDRLGDSEILMRCVETMAARFYSGFIQMAKDQVRRLVNSDEFNRLS